jgi:Rod binding domain-containing protein
MQPITPNPNLYKIPAPGWTPPTDEQRSKQLEGQVEEFASLLYAQMFQQMREASKVSDEGDEEGGGGGMFGGDSEMFASYFDQQVGKVFAHQAGNGLKQALWEQMSKTLEAQNAKAKGENQ